MDIHMQSLCVARGVTSKDKGLTAGIVNMYWLHL